MATHSKILAWRIPQTEEPGGLQSMGLQRVGHSEVKVKVAQSYPTLQLYSPVHEILQSRILEWVAFPFSKVFSQSTDRTQASHISGGFFTS